MCIRDRVTCVGFADDACLIITGKDIKTMYRLMNKAIATAISWADKYGLVISQEKTIAMLFTGNTGYSLDGLDISIKGVNIPLSKEAKYLGVIVDCNLTWESHIMNKISQAKKVLFAAKGALGKLWGPKPELMKWLWTAVIRPMISYASIIWGKGIKTHLKAKLRSLQRLALLCLGHVRRGTPTAGLEVITDTMPIDLFIEQESVNTYLSLIHI